VQIWICAVHLRSLCSARAIEPSCLLAWDIGTFDAFASRFPQILRNDTNILGERLRVLQYRFRDMATEPVPQRLSRLLLSLLEQGTDATRGISVGRSQEELAHMAGTTISTISRVLCDRASLASSSRSARRYL
jgi:CRP-like cAMP-binding protein